MIDVPPGPKDRVRLWLRLLKIVRSIEHTVRDNLRDEFETTLPRFDLMSALSRHPEGLKMSHLSGLLRISNGNVTGIADRLSEEGFVKRVPVPGDRRATTLLLTPKGQAEFARQAHAHEVWVNDILADIPPDEAREIVDRLAMLSNLKEKKEKAHAQ